MKIKPMLIAAMLAVGGRACIAQALTPDIITSNGNYFSNANCSLSWTMGEPLTETDVSATDFLTQGFQQPASIIVTSVTKPEQGKGDVSVYPNPFSSTVYLQNNDAGKTLQVELLDMSGKTVLKKTITGKEEQFDLSSFSNGIYFLRVYNVDNQLIQILKIDKVK